ncbi:MAG TPA: hypothetical protein VMU97_02820 [Candidatus Dormibacteraeota bacterium]|nr:hypothetical protein [Candidatus Dormibacteraeota bacterium]
MFKHNQDGTVSGLGISLVLAIVLLIGALGFGGWAFSSRQDYKNNVDTKISTAVTAAKSQEDKVKDAQFAEAAKQPLKTYQGPEAYGSLMVSYPKTWSAYVDDTGKGSALVDGYFTPGAVPSISDQNSVFALRVQVLNQPYAQVLRSFSAQQQAGTLTISAYALPKLPNVVGVKAVGQVNNQASVTMIVLPLRSQTLQIWTEGTQYLNDFSNNILPYFSFSP